MKHRTITTPALRRHTFTTPAVRSHTIRLPLSERRRDHRGRRALLGIGVLLAAALAVPAALRALTSWVAGGIRVDSLDSR